VNNDFSIIEISDREKKFRYTREILEKLPDWFGNEHANYEYAEGARECTYWAAFDNEQNCIGFFALKVHYSHTGDIYVCGVLPEYHNKGIGKAIFKEIEKSLVPKDCKYVIVKTLSEAANYEPYDRTRNFYERIGFESLITLTEMWDEENPCLIMIKKLA